MQHHVSKFQSKRDQNNDRRQLYRLVIGVCFTISCFLSARFLEGYVTEFEAENKLLKTILSDGAKHSKWDYFPYLPDGKMPKFGIVMGGTSNMFEESPGSDLKLSMISTCVNKLYAMKHKYAFKLVTNLEEVSNRTYGPCTGNTMTPWNKILLAMDYLPEVEHLLWIDMDAVIVRTHLSIDFVLNASNKMTYDLGTFFGTESFSKNIHKYRTNITGSSPTPFFWASQDINPKYLVNLNSAVFVVKNIPIAFDFLSDVWAIGDDPNCFKRHDWGWQQKTVCEGYYGWPWEQGAIWDVLSNESVNSDYLRGTIIMPNDGADALNSVTDQTFLRVVGGTPFILHGKTIAKNHLHYAKMLLHVMGVGLGNLQKYCPSVAARYSQFKNITKAHKDILRYELSGNK